MKIYMKNKGNIKNIESGTCSVSCPSSPYSDNASIQNIPGLVPSRLKKRKNRKKKSNG